jgi:hypothetical protein
MKYVLTIIEALRINIKPDERLATDLIKVWQIILKISGSVKIQDNGQ